MKTLEELYARTVEEGDCRIWTGAGKKLPHLNTSKGRINVRLLVLQASGSQIRANCVLGCSCGNEKCIELTHIRQRSRKEHASYFGRLGAYSSPAKIAKMASTKRKSSKLDDRKVAEIRASEDSALKLSAIYGVAPSYITSIRAGKLWKNYASPFAGLGARS